MKAADPNKVLPAPKVCGWGLLGVGTDSSLVVPRHEIGRGT